MRRFFVSLFFVFDACLLFGQQKEDSFYSGNPLFPGWYADPEAEVFGKEYWIYPTYSAPFDKQVFFDAFSSRTWYTGQNIHAFLILRQSNGQNVQCGLRP